MTDEARLLEAAYLDALLAISDVLGIEKSVAGWERKPAISLESIPASALVAGRAAMRFLAVGAGILDNDSSDSSGVSAEEALAAWTREETPDG